MYIFWDIAIRASSNWRNNPIVTKFVVFNKPFIIDDLVTNNIWKGICFEFLVLGE